MRRAAGALLAAGLLAAAAAPRAEVYRWTDASGKVHYSDRKPAGTAAETVTVDERQPVVPPPAPATPAAAAPPAAPAKARQPQPEVTMYMRPSCGWCVRAAKYFQARGVAWRNVDISADARGQAEFDALGGRGTPLIYIAGQRIRGFDRPVIDQALARFGW